MRRLARISRCTRRSLDPSAPVRGCGRAPTRSLRGGRSTSPCRRRPDESGIRPCRARRCRAGVRRLRRGRRRSQGSARRGARPLCRHALRRCDRGVRSGLRAGGKEALAMARIEDYALLGDLQTAALVERNGSIDWLCFPRFDSGACFAALLGDERNGRWLLAPAKGGSPARRYRGDTLVLETTWETETGSARVLDFMPPRGK